MAGGKGSRLGAYTKNCPKPLLKIGSKPILEHIINNAKSQGYVNFLIAINYLGEMIKEYFGDNNPIRARSYLKNNNIPMRRLK